MIDTSKMTDAAFLRTLRMRYRSVERPEITTDEIRRLLHIASDLRIFRDIGGKPGLPIAFSIDDGSANATGTSGR